MKAIQILTQGSIEKIERAIIFLEVYNDVIKNEKTPEVIADLKEIIKDVNS